jgi:hypothetical protein
MRDLKYLGCALVFCVNFALNAQTEAQVNAELQERDITTQADIDAELAKRGMTASEARNMALMYGIDYDDYIAKYILPSKPDIPSAQEPAMQQTDATVTSISMDAERFDARTDATNIDTPNVNLQKVDPTYFGYEIFQNNPFAEKEYMVGNIDEGYILSPGDELRLYIWGSNSYQAQVKIDLNGNIALPDNGVFFCIWLYL